MTSDLLLESRWQDGVTPNSRQFSGCDWRLAVGDREAAERLPYCLRILLENCLRNMEAGWATISDVTKLAGWRPGGGSFAIPTRVSRVIIPDSSGLPALMDLAALRDALARHGGDPGTIQPQIPVDLVIDHSLIVDNHGSANALELNVKREFERNNERYRFFKWAQNTFRNLRVVPPGMGIIHQVHLERLAAVIQTEQFGDEFRVYPEFVLGGDSHTPMVNGLGVLAWGVGGVEIDAALLGEPYVVNIPRVVGVQLKGNLPTGATVTDIVLTITERLRQKGVTGDFVEFYGPSYGALTVPDRATIANMAPEYGATVAYFPIDQNTLDYLRQTGRDANHVDLVEAYARRFDLFRDERTREPEFDEIVVVDLSEIQSSIAGPKRPDQRLPLSAASVTFHGALRNSPAQGGYGVSKDGSARRIEINIDGQPVRLSDGFLAIAAITACTSTSNPSVMLAAGLLARNAVRRGLTVPSYVKTSLAPGSLVVSHYLSKTGLLTDLEKLGFYVVGYACTTCSGKSGPLHEAIAAAIDGHEIIAAAVVSSNRNFEGRLHRQVRAGYLASPPLVVAFAIAGRIDIDLTREPLGRDSAGEPVYLADIWPNSEDISSLLAETRRPETYRDVYSRVFDGTAQWQQLSAPDTLQFPWSGKSTYILRPPFFDDDRILAHQRAFDDIVGARALGVFGDNLSTDHISPAGEIPKESMAGRYLLAAGVAPRDFNAFTMRRGNHHVMARGTYAHIRTLNGLVPDQPGGFTLKLPQRRIETVYSASEEYRNEATPLIVIGGRNYGMGSSRDWAAKGPELLGVRAVIAVSFERIHRSNLIALGILPLMFEEGQDRETLGLSGEETFFLHGVADAVQSGRAIDVEARRDDGRSIKFQVHAALSSAIERETLAEGGIFKRVFNRFFKDKQALPERILTS